MSIVVGLDLSLRSTGLVVLGPELVSTVAIPIISRSRGMARVEELHRRIWEETRPHRPVDLWVLEGYAYGVAAGASQLADLAEFGGVVKYALHRARQRWLLVPPARLKKFCSGRGTAKKDEMRLAVYKRWSFEHPSPDVIDAYALARLGLAVLGHQEGLTDDQRRVAEELRCQLRESA